MCEEHTVVDRDTRDLTSRLLELVAVGNVIKWPERHHGVEGISFEMIQLGRIGHDGALGGIFEPGAAEHVFRDADMLFRQVGECDLVSPFGQGERVAAGASAQVEHSVFGLEVAVQNVETAVELEVARRRLESGPFIEFVVLFSNGLCVQDFLPWFVLPVMRAS